MKKKKKKLNSGFSSQDPSHLAPHIGCPKLGTAREMGAKQGELGPPGGIASAQPGKQKLGVGVFVFFFFCSGSRFFGKRG